MLWHFKLLLTALVTWRLTSASAAVKDIIYKKLNTSQVQTFRQMYCGQLSGTTSHLECLAAAQKHSPLVVGYNSEKCLICEVLRSSSGSFVTLENTFSDTLGWYFAKGKLSLKTGRYTIFTDAETYARAKELCSVEDGHLVAYETEDEYNAITKPENRWRRDWGYWVGASDLITEGQFIWEHSGQKLTDTFAKWYSGNPSTDNSMKLTEDCVNMWEAQFHDILCDGDKQIPICEYEYF